MQIDEAIVQRWQAIFKRGDLTKIEAYVKEKYPKYEKRHARIPNAIRYGFGDEETAKIINEYYGFVN